MEQSPTTPVVESCIVHTPGSSTNNNETVSNDSSSCCASSNSQTVDADACTRTAEQLIANAIQSSQAIESRLKYLADVEGGRMIGLEFKIKPMPSLVRKMMSMWRPGMTMDQLATLQYDVLRFTILFPPENYTWAVRRVIEDLHRYERCQPIEIKNYWDCLTYKGINTIFQSDTNRNTKFELQFHTPESFDEKQNRTHVLYKTLQKESDPVKQNVFYEDMVSMWDSVIIPESVSGIGSRRTQPLPERKPISEAEAKLLKRASRLKEQAREFIKKIQSRVKDADTLVHPCVIYACNLYGARTCEFEYRFKSTLRIARKVEEELRRKQKIPPSAFLYEVDLPSTIDGIPLWNYVELLCLHQPDVVMYKVICPDPCTYVEKVTGIVDVMLLNGFEVIGAKNFWSDIEKHHAFSVTFEIPEGHVVKPSCRFQMEFHTKESYECTVERRTALAYAEERLYSMGEVFNKAAVDMQVRFDAVMMRHWAKVSVPKGVETIGCVKKAVQGEIDLDMETYNLPSWKTPGQRARERRKALLNTAYFVSGIAVGAAGVYLWSKYRTYRP